MSAGLEALRLHKRYGERIAVEELSLQVAPGELLALLGPNGAGKSTTLAMISGLLTPDRGRVRIGMAELARERRSFQRRIGLVPQEIALFEGLSARRNVALFGALYGLGGRVLRQRVDACLDRVGLLERADDRPETFSGGMKRRLNIACALVHGPDLLLLDEPTAGVDPHSRNAIFETLEALKAEGKALVYTTHYMEEAERLADRVQIIDQGRVVAAGTLGELLALLPAAQQLLLTLEGPPDAAPLLALPGVRELQALEAGRWRVGLDSLASAAALLAELQRQGLALRHISSGRASLEHVFLHLTGRQLRDAE